jgi:hypothetical protein
MSVEIEMSSIFSRYTHNALNTTVEGRTVRECFDALVRQFPDLQKILFDKDGKLMRSYDYYINGKSVFPKDMSRPLQDGDKLNINFVIFGG